MSWTANYSDGTTLKQYNADGSENTYNDIDREKLVSFSLFVFGRNYILDLDTERRLIYRKRTKVSSTGKQEDIYLLGWQKTVKGENIQSIMFIGEDGVVASGRWGQGMFASPDFLAYE